MKYHFLKNILATLLIATQVITVSWAQDVLPRPNEKDLVFDYANVLSKTEAQELNQIVEQFAVETSNQILGSS